MYLDGKIDLMVSQWTLRHLVDSLGTFLQMHQLTKLNRYMLLEGLCFDRLDVDGDYIYEGYSGNGYEIKKEENLNSEHLLRDLKQVYLMCPKNHNFDQSFDTCGSRDIIIKKSNIDASAKQNLFYINLRKINGEDNCDYIGYICEFITQFRYTGHTAKLQQNEDWFSELYSFRGHEELYNMIKEKKLFCNDAKEYGNREFFSVKEIKANDG